MGRGTLFGGFEPLLLPSVHQPTGRQGLHPLEGRSSRTAPTSLVLKSSRKLESSLVQLQGNASTCQLACHAGEQDSTHLQTLKAISTSSGEQKPDKQSRRTHTCWPDEREPDTANSTLQVAASICHEQRDRTRTPRSSSDKAHAGQPGTRQARQNGESPPRNRRERQTYGAHVRLLVAFAAPFFWVGGPCSLQMLVAFRRPLLHG